MTALTATVLYIVSAFGLAREVREPGAPMRMGNVTRGALVLALLAALLHAGYHAQNYAAAGGIDFRFFAALSLAGLGVALVTTAMAWLRPVTAMGVAVYPIAAATLIGYFAFGPPSPAAVTRDWRIEVHALLALLAYATLSVAALMALGLWFQERALRRHQLKPLLRAFPPLTQMEALLFRVILAGFVLLTLALVTGVVFVENLFAQHLVHKTALSILAWLTFGALLVGRRAYGWRGRRAVQLVLVAMFLLLLAFFGSKFVLELVLGRTV